MADTVEKVKLVIEGDTNGVNAALDRFARGVKESEKATKSLIERMDAANGAIELVGKTIQSASQAFEFVKANGATEKFNQNLAEVTKSSEALKRTIAESVSQSTAFSSAMEESSEALDELNRIAKASGVSIGDTLAGAFQLARVPIIAFRAAVFAVQGPLGGLAYGIGSLLAATKSISPDLGAAGEALKQFGVDNIRDARAQFDAATASAEAMRAGLARVREESGKSLGSKAVEGGTKTSSPRASNSARAQIEAEKERFRLIGEANRAETEALYELRAAEAELSDDRLELIRIERDRRIEALQLAGASAETIALNEQVFRLKLDAEYNDERRRSAEKFMEEERKGKEKHLEQVKKYIELERDRVNALIRSESEARAEAQEALIAGLNRTSSFISAGFSAGRAWKSAFEAGAKPADIFRTILQTIAQFAPLVGALGGPVGAAGGGVLGAFTGGLAGLFHSGGMIRQRIAHSGLSVPPSMPGEVNIRALPGEAVLNRDAVQSVGGEDGINAINSGARVGQSLTFAPVFNVASGVRREEVLHVLRTEMVSARGEFMRELRRTGAVRGGAR